MTVLAGTCFFLSLGNISFAEDITVAGISGSGIKKGVSKSVPESTGRRELRPDAKTKTLELPNEQKNIENQQSFSLHVKNAPVQGVLQSLAELTHKNIIFSGTLSSVVTADIDHVTPEEAMEFVLASSGLAAKIDERNIVIFNENTGEKKKRIIRSYRLSYADAEEVAESLNHLSEDGRVSYNRTANAIFVSGTPLELMQTEELLRHLDIPEKQVKIEAEVIAVNRSQAKELGIDWEFKPFTGSAGYHRENGHEKQYVTDKEGEILYDKNGNPRMKNIEHNGWNVSVPEGYAGISYGRSITGHPYTFFFQARLNALVSQGKARILAKPNVVTMNGKEAEILIGNKIPVLVEHVDNGVRTTTTEYRDAGIKLSYTPRISEKNEITAHINAEVSTPYLVPEMKAYRIITRQADTMVRLKSGDMLTIGGLIDKEESRTFRKIPVLGDIPLLGKLFQSRSKSLEESEIVIIIRADIVE